MSRDFTNTVNQILDTSFNSGSVSSFLNGIQVALSLGKSDPNYTYPAFQYLLKVLSKPELKDLYVTKDKKFTTTVHELMVESFINPHLEHGIALPENFSHIFEYFSKDIFEPDTRSNVFEAAKYHRHLRFLRSTMYQSEPLFNNMIQILKNEPSYMKIEEPKLFFALMDQVFINYYSYMKEDDKNSIFNRRLTYYIHEKAYEPLAIKLDYEHSVNNQPKSIIFNLPDNFLYFQKLLNCIVEPNEEHLKINSLYDRSKTIDIKVCNKIINNIENIVPIEVYLEMTSFLKVNFMKLFTVGNISNKSTTRANYISFATICANSTENYNTDRIEHTGSRWFKVNSDEDKLEIFEKFSDYDKCNKLLHRLYQDFVTCPHRDDLRISLFSHLDKFCISEALDYFSANKDNIIEALEKLPKNQIIYLNDLSYRNNISKISHLLFAYQENPIVVFHSLKLQSIHDILSHKKSKKYICTEDELKIAEKQAYTFIEKIASTFLEIKPYLGDLRISPVLLNEPANPSYLTKNDNTLIPFSYNQPPQQYSSSEINNLYSAYNYFMLEHKIGMKKYSVVKKNKI